MKRISQLLIVIVVMLAVSLNVNAQFKKKENNRVPDRFHMGIRAGYSLSVIEVEGVGFPQGGLAMDFQIAPIPLFLETGAYYMNKGREGSNHKAKDDHSVYLPLLLSYHINIGPNLFLQPFLGGVGAYLFDTEEFDPAIRAGLGFNFGRLYSNIGIDCSLTSHEDKFSTPYNHEAMWTNYNLFFTIGFNWSGNR